jgi:hypothetical protein
MEPPKPNVSYKEEGFMVKEFKYRIPPHVKKTSGAKSIMSHPGHGVYQRKEQGMGVPYQTPAAGKKHNILVSKWVTSTDIFVLIVAER